MKATWNSIYHNHYLYLKWSWHNQNYLKPLKIQHILNSLAREPNNSHPLRTTKSI